MFPHCAPAAATLPCAAPRPLHLMRWWIYQKERFPLAAHAPLIAAFSACAVTYAALLTGGPRPGAMPFVVAFVTSLLFFLQLRIADEFKDAGEDAAYRPYRPVPRGLVTLAELRRVFIAGGAIQLALALWYQPLLALVLLLAWLYLGLMCVEFFARDWLVARPITYLWTHMLIMPIVDLYATAAYWLPLGLAPKVALLPFLAASFANGLVIELGRKIRQPDAEETGVPTYSRLWGRHGAVLAWIGCLGFTLACSLLAAARIDALWLHAACMAPLLLLCLLASRRFLAGKTTGKSLETAAGLWTLVLYISLGLLPWLLSLRGAASIDG